MGKLVIQFVMLALGITGAVLGYAAGDPGAETIGHVWVVGSLLMGKD